MTTATAIRPAEHAAPAAADWRALGCSVRLVVEDRRALDACRDSLATWLDAVDAACSRFRADSELTIACNSGREQVEVSPLLADAVDAALRAARLTDGLVDPTVGAAMAGIGYDRDFELIDPAGPPVHVTVRPVPGWHLVHLERDAGSGDEARPAVLTMREGVSLDLGATAKAWAADRAATELAEAAGCGVLVSLGGDIAVGGRPPLRENGIREWRVTVRDQTDGAFADAAGPEFIADIGLLDGGLASSGTASRRWLRGGDLFHHLLDPRTGLPAATPWRTVSVVAGSCLDANTASTAAMLLGAEAPAWLAQHALSARLVPEGGGPVVHVAGWPEDAERGV